MPEKQLVDNFGRPIEYLRLAVTDRCNLRCFYCMPAEGINFLPRKDILSYEEMLRLARVFCKAGISKIRITGGEPFVRKDMIHLMRELSKTPGLKELNITTNGVLTHQYIAELKEIGISSVNLSLDTIDPEKFFQITRRDEFANVWKTFQGLVEHNIKTKLNMVVMAGQNDEDIIPMAELAEKYPVNVRFIEEMPFNGSGQNNSKIAFNHIKILETLKERYPNLSAIETAPNATASLYSSSELKGNLGIIAAYSRTFCGSCNRLRVTAKGELKTCLYSGNSYDFKEPLRNNASESDIISLLQQSINSRHKDGFAAEADRDSSIHESMTTIGG